MGSSLPTKLSHDEPKAMHELALAQQFVMELSGLGEEVSDAVAGDAWRGEPDALCSRTDGTVIGIEIAAGYYGPRHARTVWAPTRGKPFDPNGGAVNPDESLGKALNRTALDHCRKTYSVATYLLLDATLASLTTAEDAAIVIHELHLPEPCPFIAICVVFNQPGQSEKMFIDITTGVN